MAIALQRGKQILEKVRKKISDETYASYDEINEAHRYLLSKAAYNFLRKNNILGYGLYASTKEYDLNLGNIRSIESIWIAGSSSTDVGDIEGITLSGSNPVSIQITAHGLTTGRQVVFASVGGTTELNSNTYKITKTDADNFTLQGTDSSNFTAWTSGGSAAVWDIDDGAWHLMTESPSNLFEEMVKANTVYYDSITTGTVAVTTTELTTNRTSSNWTYTLRAGDSAPFMKMAVSPTPNTTYKIKINYIKNPEDISEDTIPDLPPAYNDLLVNYAAGLILEMKDDENEVIKGRRYMARAERQMWQLTRDAHRNRSNRIDKPAAFWKY